MKKIVLFMIILFSLFIFTGCPISPSGDTGNPEPEINSALDNYEKAFIEQDTKHIEPILAEEITVVSEDEENVYTKTEYISLMEMAFGFIEEVKEFSLDNRELIVNDNEANVRMDSYSKTVSNGETREQQEEATVKFKKENDWVITEMNEIVSNNKEDVLWYP